MRTILELFSEMLDYFFELGFGDPEVGVEFLELFFELGGQ